MQKIQKEIRDHYNLNVFNDKEFLDQMNLDKIFDLKYLSYSINEVMRIEPPVWISGTFETTEAIKVQNYHIKAGTCIVLNFYQLGKLTSQWKEHEKYIPDRFNPESPYYLTPSG
jgi:cytochrome P450